jgi:hypothetical protein
VVVGVESQQLTRHLLVPCQYSGVEHVGDQVHLVPELPGQQVGGRAPASHHVAETAAEELPRRLVAEEPERSVERSTVLGVVGIVRPLGVGVEREGSVVLDREHHVDVVSLGGLEHPVELPGAVETVVVVTQARDHRVALAPQPLDAEGPARHPQAHVVHALSRELGEPVVVREGAPAVVPGEVLAQREERCAVVEAQIARVEGAHPQEAVSARGWRIDLELLPGRCIVAVGCREQPAPAPRARSDRCEAHAPVRTARDVPLLEPAHELARVLLRDEARHLEALTVGGLELSAQIHSGGVVGVRGAVPREPQHLEALPRRRPARGLEGDHARHGAMGRREERNERDPQEDLV